MIWNHFHILVRHQSTRDFGWLCLIRSILAAVNPFAIFSFYCLPLITFPGISWAALARTMPISRRNRDLLLRFFNMFFTNVSLSLMIACTMVAYVRIGNLILINRLVWLNGISWTVNISCVWCFQIIILQINGLIPSISVCWISFSCTRRLVLFVNEIIFGQLRFFCFLRLRRICHDLLLLLLDAVKTFQLLLLGSLFKF